MDDGVRPRGRGKGKRGGGPTSDEGKAVVRLNPIRHGVLSQTPVIPLVEQDEDWDRLQEGLYRYWKPHGMMEEILVLRLATIIWRQYRAMRFEREAIFQYLKDVPRDWKMARLSAGLPVPDRVTPEAVAEMDRMLVLRLLPGDETIEKVMRYDTKLHRFLLQTTHELLMLKGVWSEDEGPTGKGYGNLRRGRDGVPELEPPSAGPSGQPKLKGRHNYSRPLPDRALDDDGDGGE